MNQTLELTRKENEQLRREIKYLINSQPTRPIEYSSNNEPYRDEKFNRAPQGGVSQSWSSQNRDEHHNRSGTGYSNKTQHLNNNSTQSNFKPPEKVKPPIKIHIVGSYTKEMPIKDFESKLKKINPQIQIDDSTDPKPNSEIYFYCRRRDDYRLLQAEHTDPHDVTLFPNTILVVFYNSKDTDFLSWNLEKVNSGIRLNSKDEEKMMFELNYRGDTVLDSEHNERQLTRMVEAINKYVKTQGGECSSK